MKVVVLGCGPAGLVAAHAAAIFPGVEDVRILSKPRKSYMKGAQYLHAPIPLMGDQTPFDIDYRLVGGTAAEYAKKVYGAARVSPEDVSVAALEGIHPGWDIRSAYDDLWAAYGSYVTEWEASIQGLIDIQSNWDADLIISSIPATLLCDAPDQHAFSAENIWSTDRAMHYPNDVNNMVVCNAGDTPAWYRSAQIHGWGTTEWPDNKKPPFGSDHLWHVVKPIGTNCTCFKQVLRVGRYGTWTKGTLVHEVFKDVVRELQIMSDRLW